MHEIGVENNHEILRIENYEITKWGGGGLLCNLLESPDRSNLNKTIAKF